MLKQAAQDQVMKSMFYNLKIKQKEMSAKSLSTSEIRKIH